nr:hypothetical protein [uncultured Schaedlerella sp.]
MVQILLISNDEEIYRLTKNVVSERGKLTWKKYDFLNKNENISSDVVIMFFNKEMVKKGAFESIIKAKGKLGSQIPILVLLEEAVPQEIISILKAGAYDYLDISEIPEKYSNKIDELIRWDWYQKKYKQ